MVGFVGLQQFLVDGNGVVDCGGKWMLRSEAIEHCDDFDSGVAGDGDGFGKGTRVGVKTTAMQVDKNLVAVTGGQVGGSDDATGTPAMVESAMVFGQSLLQAAFWRAAHASVWARRVARDSGGP